MKIKVRRRPSAPKTGKLKHWQTGQLRSPHGILDRRNICNHSQVYYEIPEDVTKAKTLRYAVPCIRNHARDKSGKLLGTHRDVNGKEWT